MATSALRVDIYIGEPGVPGIADWLKSERIETAGACPNFFGSSKYTIPSTIFIV